MLHAAFLLCSFLLAGSHCAQETDARLRPYLDVIDKQGSPPLHFALERLKDHDLLIVDDGLHSAVEAFLLVQDLVRAAEFQRLAPRIFLEAIPSNKQRHLDAYLAAPSEEHALLFPAFQDDISGQGWTYQSYFDLLKTVREVNKKLPKETKLRVVGVGSPTFWREIETPADLEQFRKALASYDHHMYMTILNELDGLGAGKKGVFLTNTRHAYKGIKRKDGGYFWNVGTFFHQWHPGKAYSIRLHHLQLSIRAVKAPPTGAPKTAEGMERIDYRFVRMAAGLWDSAFLANGNRPVAFPLAGNVFGAEPYLGNHQLDAAPGQTLQDAYDALIFLVPLEELRQSAISNVIYTPEFRRELARRYLLLHSPVQIAELLKREGVESLDQYFERRLTARPEQKLPQLQSLGPIDEWKQR